MPQSLVSKKEKRSLEMDTVNMPDVIRALLYKIENAPLRQDLEATPKRTTKALAEMLDGYDVNIEELFTTFDDKDSIPPNNGQDIHDQIVAVKNVPFYSMCEHHLLPFFGTASIAYLPKDKVIGASKLPRILLVYAHRLQLQERIARQVANAIMTHLSPYGVAVIIEAKHLCIACRGVRSECSFVTSVMLGTFRDEPVQRLEVLSLLGIKNECFH